ncbi:MAG: DUF6345 domain-containing protein [Chloroflexales bacterium]
MYSRGFHRPALTILLLVALGVGLSGVLTARSSSRPFVSANGITLQAGQLMSIYKLTVPSLTPAATSSLSQRFSGIYSRQGGTGTETYLGKLRYTVPNTTTHSLLTQYGATGGFYALNFDEMGLETPRGTISPSAAGLLACQFLSQKGFIDSKGNLLLDPNTPQGVHTPAPLGCQIAPELYQTHLISAASVPAATPNAVPTEQTVGVVVEVPVGIPQVGIVAALPDLPLGGPGGHLSLLFSTTDPSVTGHSLDSSVPGLAAVAMPFFGRSLQTLRSVQIADPTVIASQVKQDLSNIYPGATINVPTPTTYYQVLDAAAEQGAIEPVLDFSGIEVTPSGGEKFTLRSFTEPLAQSGTGGFGPAVSITAPTDGSTFALSTTITFDGQISSGTAPYTYQWLSSDGQTLSDPAQLAAAGPVQLETTKLLGSGKVGTPGPLSVTLHVTDADGAVREATVNLTLNVPSPAAYLPLVITSSNIVTQAAAPAASLDQTSYTFGTEANWDYPPTGAGGPDLPGVIPDASSFRSGMSGYGYSSRFYWTNSSAWERDWRDCGLGGGDCSYGVDRADFVFYSGHGGAGGIALASNKDSTWFDGNNARYQNLRWAGFSSCQTLRVQGYAAPTEPIRHWFNAFQGAHLLMGFNSNMADISFGGRLVDNMRVPSFFGIDFPWAQMTIAQAWVTTAFELNAGKPAYIYALGGNGANPSTDKLPRPGTTMPPRPLPVVSYHWVWWNS